MCYADGSLEQATSTCAMCKVFPPPSRNNYSCPHKDTMGVCKNRVNHPRHDVVHFRTAELPSFNGCGYCKWAKRHPKALAADAAWKNPGWPGCCRPPKPTEYEFINSADWYAISKIHGIPAPAPSTPGGSPPRSHITPNKSPSNSPPSRSHAIATVTPRTLERRDSGSREPGSPYSAGGGREPGLSPSTPKGDLDVRRRSNSDISRKPDTLAPVRAPVVIRESATNVPRSPTRPSNPGSPRKDNEREMDRPKVLNEEKERDKERRIATKTHNADNAFSTVRVHQHHDPPPPRPSNPAVPRSSASSSSSSSSSSGSRSSVTQSGTVTSEGFTDYLSDESEVEMQREAERRAGEAELAAKLKLEGVREEQEFRAARTQLAAVGLQPPPAWSSGRLAAGNGKTPQASAAQTTYTAAPRQPRSPGNIYSAHSAPSAPSYVQVYQTVRQ